MILGLRVDFYLMAETQPILYSFRRCPFAIRARLILKICNVTVRLREIELKDKPKELLQASSKATVPVLILPDQILEQSMDIILWALSVSDPHNILVSWNADKAASAQFLKSLDDDFKHHLDRYKYAGRFEPKDKKFHRDLAMLWIENIEVKLSEMPYLSGKAIGIFDYMCLPFIRQFRIADPDWFDSQKLPNLHKRLSQFLESDLFKQVMQKIPIWEKTGIEIEF